MSEEKEDKFFRRPGEPLRIQVCRMDDAEAVEMVRMANRMGYVPYQVRDKKGREWLCVDVLGEGLVWRAPDAEFRRVADGLYHFTQDEKGNSFVEGPY